MTIIWLYQYELVGSASQRQALLKDNEVLYSHFIKVVNDVFHTPKYFMSSCYELNKYYLITTKKNKYYTLTKTASRPVGIHSNCFNSWKCAEQESFNHGY